jgi:hypothetical protein
MVSLYISGGIVRNEKNGGRKCILLTLVEGIGSYALKK